MTTNELERQAKVNDRVSDAIDRSVDTDGDTTVLYVAPEDFAFAEEALSGPCEVCAGDRWPSGRVFEAHGAVDDGRSWRVLAVERATAQSVVDAAITRGFLPPGSQVASQTHDHIDVLLPAATADADAQACVDALAAMGAVASGARVTRSEVVALSDEDNALARVPTIG